MTYPRPRLLRPVPTIPLICLVLLPVGSPKEVRPTRDSGSVTTTSSSSTSSRSSVRIVLCPGHLSLQSQSRLQSRQGNRGMVGWPEVRGAWS